MLSTASELEIKPLSRVFRALGGRRDGSWGY